MGIGTSDGEYYDDRLSHALASEPTREAQAIPEDVKRIYITPGTSTTNTEMPLGSTEKPAGEFKSSGGTGVPGNQYETKLDPSEEVKFQSWKQQNAPKDSGFDYDLRGAFKAGVTPDEATGHWPDTFKKPNHPTFSDQSQYAKDRPDLAGSWDGDRYLPPAQASSIADDLFGKGPNDIRPALTHFYETVKNAFKLPGDVYSGKVPAGSIQEIERASDLAGLMVGGPAPVARKMADGTLGSFAGVRSELFKNPATSADMRSVLQHAQDLERQGANQDIIWDKTGFFKGADNRWRFEIPDRDMNLKNEAFLPTVNEAGKLEGVTPKAKNPIYRPLKTLQDFKDSFNKEKPLYLKDAIDHPKLFAAYPELKGIKVYELPAELNLDGTTKGMMWGDELYLRPGLPRDEVRSIMMHEVQHRIQSIEGFASGGSPEMFQPKAWKGAMEEFEKAKSYTENLLKEKKVPGSAGEALTVAIRSELNSGYESIHPHYKSIIDSAKKVGVYQPVKNLIKTERLIDKATMEWHQKYEALMGEVESRNVQARMDYDKTLRRLLPPGRTELIPRFMQTDPKDLGFSSSSVSKSTEPTQFRRAANENIKDLNNPNLSDVEQLARKLAESENGKGSWDRIGGGGQEHYWRDAEKALKKSRGDYADSGKGPPGFTLEQHFNETVTKPHEEFIKKWDKLNEFGDFITQKGNWTELNVARYNKMGRELGGDWTDVPFDPAGKNKK